MEATLGENIFGPKKNAVRLDASGAPIRNEILESLPAAEFQVLRPHLEHVDLARESILHEAGQEIEFAYFLNDGIASLVVLTLDGKSVEVGVVGSEGIVGTAILAGLSRTPLRALMQTAGAGLRVRSTMLLPLLGSVPQLCLQWNRFVLVQSLQLAQMAACNRLHEISKRLARWLLMCQDRVASESLEVTHEFLAQMLGTGRPSVSVAAGALERQGFLENLRGTVKIIDRPGLENVSCECYGVMRRLRDIA